MAHLSLIQTVRVRGGGSGFHLNLGPGSFQLEPFLPFDQHVEMKLDIRLEWIERERERVMEYLLKEESALVGHDGDYRICKSGFTRNKRWVDHCSKTVLLLFRFNREKPSTATWDLTDSSRIVEISSAQRAETPSVIK